MKKCNNCGTESCANNGKIGVPIGCYDYTPPMPQTHADRIRAMTDEELTEWVTLIVCKYRSCGNCPMADWCTPDRGIADWLKSPADKEAD